MGVIGLRLNSLSYEKILMSMKEFFYKRKLYLQDIFFFCD